MLLSFDSPKTFYLLLAPAVAAALKLYFSLQNDENPLSKEYRIVYHISLLSDIFRLIKGNPNISFGVLVKKNNFF